MAARAPAPAPEVSVLEQIAQTAEEIRKRKAEVKDLDARAAALVATDPDKSVDLDLKARALERLIARLVLSFNDLVERRHHEQLAERLAAIDALVEAKMKESAALADRLRSASDEFFASALRLAAISPANMSAELNGMGLLSWVQIPAQSPFRKRIDDGLYVRAGQLERAKQSLRRGAVDPNWFPANQADGIAYVELRALLPPFQLEDITLDAEEPEPAAEPEPVELVTN